ncbi:competence type IV pilus assembly protein ComGB [Halalkalibacterium halodurans]|uniref:competence type IV pilus assembly protein ComGB n=1 Tax=Halalkalibacterium halodurans TaxID=86665 RepID=UPI00031A9492|nr:competence type IV pilus assembly protein ComGB [Halalkalibacterium halodurans]MDY7223383.1 competence type IV pilus assembly protein ComGB [Halalkalibacterium halodurans]MDY7242604.1 competence type IV pilus assembly protein ComGB [Halalkalibacterium halodurans]MED4081689.1 competence type IV pilus assembly protein ComGB [Halalkalibacterium halodurans]MED4085242.1 competence type IV pilus assembly protein ComGB [Halalkalibacterium halodurans]MED4104214.1 competence type IV pilus assembly p
MPFKGAEWSKEKKARYLMHVGQLLEQGYHLYEAVQFLAIHAPSSAQKKMNAMLMDLRSGYPLHKALDHLQLPQDVQLLLYVSERNGDLAQGFRKSGELFKKREEMKRKWEGAMRYPLLLIIVTLLLMFILMYFVLPHHQTLYRSLQIELPVITKLVIACSEKLPWLFTAFFVVAILLVLTYFVTFHRFPPTKKVTVLLRIPGLSQWTKEVITCLFCLTLGGLLKGGLSIMEALSICKEQDFFLFFRSEGEEMMLELENGERLYECLRRRPHYLKELPFVVENGEKTGNLAKDLLYFSDYQLEEFERRVKKWLVAIQPIVFSMIGAVILVLFLAMMLPVFQMIGAI